MTDIRKNRLIVQQNPNVRYRNVKKLYVTVYSREIPEAFFATGASRLICAEPIKVNKIRIETRAASKLQFKHVESTETDIQMDDASSLDIAGKAETIYIDMSAASKLHAKDLETNRCDVKMSGASKAEVGTILEELSVRASGASHFDYRGTPTIKKREVSGAAKVRPY